MSDFRTMKLDKDVAALWDAELFYEWALRHGNPGDCSRGRRFIAEAKAVLAARHNEPVPNGL